MPAGCGAGTRSPARGAAFGMCRTSGATKGFRRPWLPFPPSRDRSIGELVPDTAPGRSRRKALHAGEGKGRSGRGIGDAVPNEEPCQSRRKALRAGDHSITDGLQHRGVSSQHCAGPEPVEGAARRGFRMFPVSNLGEARRPSGDKFCDVQGCAARRMQSFGSQGKQLTLEQRPRDAVLRRVPKACDTSPAGLRREGAAWRLKARSGCFPSGKAAEKERGCRT